MQFAAFYVCIVDKVGVHPECDVAKYYSVTMAKAASTGFCDHRV